MSEYLDFRRTREPVFVIRAGTISDGYAFGNHPKPDPAVVAVIELTRHEVEHLTAVCGHDGFGMLPEAAQEVLAELARSGEETALLADIVAEERAARGRPPQGADELLIQALRDADPAMSEETVQHLVAEARRIGEEHRHD